MDKNALKRGNQSGIVSIMVVGIIAVLLTLIVLAFARITNRDLRQSLDRQLSSQAAYAAETGLNDAFHRIQAGLPSSDRNTCADGNNYVYGSAAGGPVGNNAQVTCVLVKSQLDNTRVDNQASGHTKVFTITNASQLSTLTFSWNGGSVNAASPPTFPTPGGWAAIRSGATAGTQPAVLRISIIPVTNNAAYHDRAAMIANSRTYFLYPDRNSTPNSVGTVAYNAPAQNGSVVRGGCNDTTVGATGAGGIKYTYACNVTVTDLPGGSTGSSEPNFANPSNHSTYYISIRSIYNDASYIIDGTDGTTNQLIEGAQALIDVTARGTDVLKRIQARVNTSPTCSESPLLGDALCPGYVVDTADSICKLILIPTDGTAAILPDAECTL